MNGCGGESIRIQIEGVSEGGYTKLIFEAMARAADQLPGCKVNRHKSECGGVGGMGAEEEWYIGCAHSEVSRGGQAISGVFTFVRYGSEEAF